MPASEVIWRLGAILALIALGFGLRVLWLEPQRPYPYITEVEQREVINGN